MKPSRRTAFVAAVLAVVLAFGGAPAFAEDGDRGEALREAARGGDVDRVRELLAAGVDPDAPGQYGATALAFAADKGNVAIMELLIEKVSWRSPGRWQKNNRYSSRYVDGAEGFDEPISPQNRVLRPEERVA
ncbi:MAG: ankyrin repeat domain-containing protein, partial [Acidobacteriota bacterium]